MGLAGIDSLVKGALHIENEDVAVGILSVTGLLHLQAIVVMLSTRTRGSSQKYQPKPSKSTSNGFFHLVARFRQFEGLILIGEMIEIPIHSIQCALIHAHTVSDTFAILYSLAIVLNCWWIAFPKASIQSYVVMDILLDKRGQFSL